jgi:hypothetical protein
MAAAKAAGLLLELHRRGAAAAVMQAMELTKLVEALVEAPSVGEATPPYLDHPSFLNPLVA